MELPTPRQLCSNGSPRLSEEILDGLCHLLSVDLSNTVWVQRRLINKLSGNTFATRPSDHVKIGAGPSYGTIFGTMPKIRAQMMQTVVSHGQIFVHPLVSQEANKFPTSVWMPNISLINLRLTLLKGILVLLLFFICQ